MTKPRLLIIESLRFDDKSGELFEGVHLTQILRLSASHARYMYLCTMRKLEEAIDLFEESNYCNRHIGCFGDKSGIELTLDNLSLEEFSAETGASPTSPIRIFGSTGNTKAPNLLPSLVAGSDTPGAPYA